MKGFSYCGYSFLLKIGGGKLTLSEGNSTPVKRLGIGKGRIIDPPNFDQLDKDVQDMFGEAI